MTSKFFWGVATSAHQVEGGNLNDWSEWEKRNSEKLAGETWKKSWPNHILGANPNPLNKENYVSGKAFAYGHLASIALEKDFLFGRKGSPKSSDARRAMG